MVLLALLATLAQTLEPIPPTPFDRVIELEITEDDEPLIDGKGPTVVVEYEVDFEGALHVWTKSEVDLFLQVDDATEARPLASDDDSGGGTTPYLQLDVEKGDWLMVLVAGGPGDTGALTLHLIADPGAAVTRWMRGGERARRADRLVAAGDLPGALALDEEVHAARKRLLPEDHPALLAAEQNLAATRKALGDLAGALSLFEHVHAVRERRLAEDDPDLLMAKGNLAATRYELGDIEGAHALFEHVHASFERLLPGDHPQVLAAKQNLALTRKALGDLAGALALEQHVHATLARTLPEEHPDLLRAKGNLADTLRSLGDLAGALALEEQVHDVRERVLPEDHPDLLRAKHNLALTRKALGDLAGALALEEHVHAARERLLPQDHPDLLVAKLNLASTRYSLGDLPAALALFEHVDAAFSRILPADHPKLLAAKQNLAVTRRALGDLAGALAIEEHVHTSLERLLPQDHPDLLMAKLNLATTHYTLGDLEGALALFEHVHAARERLLPEDHPDLLVAKEGLAATRKALGDFAGALALEEQVHTARERLLPEDHPGMLAIKLNLAATRRALGDLAGALALQEHVHAARERLLPADHPDLLVTKQNLAGTRYALGDIEGSLSLLEPVHAAFERLLPVDHPDLLTVKHDLAVTRARLGDLAGALALSKSIAAALSASLQRVVAASPREARQAARFAVRRLAEARCWGRSSDPELALASFEVLETARLVIGLPLDGQHAALFDEELSSIRRRLVDAEGELDRLVSSGPMGPDDGTGDREAARAEADREWRAAVQAAALRRDQAQKELRGRLWADGLDRVSLDAVSSSLPEGHLGIGVTKMDRWWWEEKRGVRVNDGPHYVAQVVAPGGSLHEVDLGSASALEQLVAAWRRALGAPIGPDVRGSSVDRGFGVTPAEGARELETGRALRTALLDPLVAAAGDADIATIHLWLDDALFTVPIDALPLGEGEAVDLPDGGDVARVGDRYLVRCGISMADLFEPSEDPAREPSVFAVGDVAFDVALDAGLPDNGPLPVSALERTRQRSSTWGAWSDLPGTVDELDELSFEAKEVLGVEATVLRGNAVTESAIAEAVRGKRYVHLATHGWFMPETIKSMIDDEPEHGRTLLSTRETVTGFAPLTLCGLVLSGANNVASEAERSARLLTAQELASMDFTACDLAVLSACETNVGIVRAGQGIQSLQTALHRAGAKSSITSLWSVQDRPTQSLMKRFYDNLWKHGMGKADALWAAKCALRAEGHAPRVWAGWVLCGDSG